MSGQPNVPGVLDFDVTILEVIEAAPPGLQENILDRSEAFQLRATFTGSGVQWGNLLTLTPSGLTYNAIFYAEGMGPFVANQNFGNATGLVNGLPFNPLTNEYQLTWAVPAGIPNAGIYRCGVVITFQDGTLAANPVFGVVGYNEDCVVQVHPRESPVPPNV